ncbi:MAG TPA: hypothetical protein VJU61_14745, partial [Polyangiaceae bacterium]|nr:hypothetical protein [Polyangiaceae bacterium]
ARAGGRFVYELGAFVGLLVVDTKQSTPEGGAASIQTVVQDQAGGAETRSCYTLVCDYPSLGGSASFVVGVTGFFGYAPAPSVGLGVRFLLGPRAGGGGLVAAGPSASFLLAERFRIGPAVLFGTASHVEQDTVQLTTPTGFNGVDSPLHGTLGFSLGVGSELGWTLFSNPTGSVVLQATPLYLYGSNGTSWSLPLGAAYHWN